MRRSGTRAPEPTSSEKDSTSILESNQNMSEASESSNESAMNEDSSHPTPGTDEVPTITIFFEKGGTRVECNEAVHSINIATLERATLQLRREVMRARRRLAHSKPARRESGWDSSHENPPQQQGA